jgi:mutator protein MutT
VSDGKNPIDVAAALVFRNGRVLITQRCADSHEPGETFEKCLVRELREELGIEVKVSGLFEEITHVYADKTVHLKFFCCELFDGEPQPLGCAAVKWAGKPELADYDFPAADARLLDKLRVYSFP